ncbi:MAG: phytanoyl-CoA dioxygenase family protein, partial [Planctomycetales bacterium]|nr:phytanoyl-CoA dioxygenase family protein [Planctomycetales bacterium]
MQQTPTFAITPTEEELARLNRRLEFVPSTVKDPAALSREQVAAFNRDGFVKGLRIFDDAEADAQRRWFDDLLARVTAAGGDSYSISTAHMKYGPVYDLLTHPRIVAYVTDLLGPNVIGWGSHYFCKMPRDGKSVSWHQDASYWPLSPSKTITVWLAIDDADSKNACMKFLPGSHLFGHLEYRESTLDEGNVLGQTVEEIERFGTPVDVELKAGEISLHSDLLLHGSGANTSDRRRCGLTLR